MPNVFAIFFSGYCVFYGNTATNKCKINTARLIMQAVYWFKLVHDMKYSTYDR